MSDAVLGAVVLVFLVPAIWFAARFASRVQDRIGARRLAPLAALIGGKVQLDPTCILAQHGGRQWRVYHSERQPVGAGEGASINAVNIELGGLSGRQNWRLLYRSTQWLGSARELFIEVADTALGERLLAAGAVAAVERVNRASEPYVVAAFDARAGVLHYNDDVAPALLPDAAQFQRQVALLLRLAEINDDVNH